MLDFQPDAFPRNVGQPVLDKQKIIDAVLQEPLEKRVARLVELGVLTNLEGYTWGHLFLGNNPSRFFVFVNLNGIPIPMYKSLSHTSGKTKIFNFFIFWGVSGGEWLVKGFRKEVNEFYGIKELEDVSSILTTVFDFNTSRRSQSEDGVDDYIPEGKAIENSAQLNKLLSKRFDIDFSRLDRETSFAGMHDHLAKKILGEAGKILKNIT